MTDAYLPPGVVAARPRTSSRFADLAPPRWFPVAAMGVAFLAATLLVGNRPGVGIPITVVAAFAATLPAIRVEPGDRPLVALAALLSLMPALRDAEWLVALDLLAIAALFALVAVGVRDWRSLAVAALSVPLRSFRAPVFLARGVARGPNLVPVVRGILVGALLVLVFGALFASADAVFGSFTERLVPGTDHLAAQLVTLVVVTVGLAGVVLAHRAPVELPEPEEPARPRPVEWLVPLVALDLLFAAFVAVQLTALFGGSEHVLETAGLTYAEYARSGFFQLLAVTALTFGVVAGAVRWAPPTRLPRTLLGVLLVLDGVVLVSALRRLGLYEQAFGLSVDRVLARTVMLWFALLLALVVVAGVTRRSAWLPRAVVTTGAATLLLLNVANPEARIAHSLVHRYEATNDVDVFYLGTLSADAVPEIMRLPADVRACALGFGGGVGDDAWPAANRSRATARALLADLDGLEAFSCATYG